MLRITAVGANAVDYLLRGSGCDHTQERAVDGPELEHGHDLGQEHSAADYFARSIAHGEPAGRWLGSGMDGLDLAARPGDVALEDEVRAVFGQLRHPDSTEADPYWLGRKPRVYKDQEQRFAALLEKEPDADPERLREMRREAETGGKRPVAYYDLTFSPAKSISVYYAAALAAGDVETAEAIRAAHDEAVKIAVAYAEEHVPYTRRGYHGRDGEGRTVGDFVRGTGLTVIAFSHSTSREAEPQLHTHAAVLNRVGTEDGHIGALDGRGFRPIKEALATAYERAVEQLITEATGAVFETRPDGLAREVVGIDPELCDDASTRRSQVVERVEDLVAAYRERYGKEPDATIRKELAQRATLDTRRPKSGLAGPAAVAAWADERREWCEAVLDAVEDAAIATRAAGRAAMAGHDRSAGPVAGDREAAMAAQREAWLGAAQMAGVADVQAKYATWTLGNLVDAIDRHLGDAAELGVPAAQRAGVVEALAREAVTAAAGLDVVQVSGHEPVAVPDALRRPEDGRPRFRPRHDERYATGAHLAAEEHVTALARAAVGPVVTDPNLTERLTATGLSPDQRAAVTGILGTDRGAAVLIGPAGAGKSRTVGAMAHEWVAATGGRVWGVAASQIATANLRGDGVTDAVNIAALLGRYRHDQPGARLAAGDLLVVDEAGMAPTADLEELARIAAEAGARVVYTGDPEQLDAVGAGGLFAHLAETLDPTQRHDLVEVHRFREAWEADASLRLRDGDHSAIDEYADRRRLHTGTVEEMAAAASRAWLADTVAGRESLLIVGTNQHAAELSASAREQLIDLGLVDGDGPVAWATYGEAAGRQPVSIGDRLQARLNRYDLRVDAGVDDRGRRGEARPVTNREVYTVLGLDAQGRVLARDARGAVAHLPLGYVAERTSLAYATTVHGAQGRNVDTAHGLIDRDASREHAYVAATRGRNENHLWLVTEREPDQHEPERVSEAAAERLADVLDRRGAQTAAYRVRDAGHREIVSLGAVAARFDVVTGWAARDRHGAALDAALGERDAQLLASDPGRGRLLRSLREAELAGHDTDRVLERVTETSFTGADSIADVLRGRVRAATNAREPERDVDATDWASRAAAAPDPEVDRYVRDVAELASQRQARLGQDAAARAPQWAVDALGAPPERHDGEGPVTEPRGRWEDRAGVAAAYRDLAGIADEQLSLGAAPSRERELHRALWRDAVDALGPADQGATDWRGAPDADLYAARERWTREQDAGPRWVADELAERHDLARQYREDATLERARLETLAADDPQASDLAERAARSQWFADRHADDAAHLEGKHQTRRTWWAEQAPQREADAAAADELARRNLPPERVPDPRAPEPDLDVVAPETEPARPDAEPLDVDRAVTEPDRAAVPELEVAAEPEVDRNAAIREAQEKVRNAVEQVRRANAEALELNEDEAIRSRYNAAEHQQQIERDMGGPELGDDW